MAGRATLMKDGGRSRKLTQKPTKKLRPDKVKRSPAQKRLTNAGLHRVGQSSKKAVRKVTKKVQARSGRNYKDAKAQARRIVRKRKAGKRDGLRGDT